MRWIEREAQRSREPGEPVAYMEDAGFFATTKSEDEAKRMANAFGYVVRPYGVDLRVINPQTLAAIEWEKVDGFSVWTR